MSTKQDTLGQRISERQPLTDKERVTLLELLGNRCRAETKRRLAIALTYVPDITNHGIHDRVILSPRVNYCAGQSYPDEIRTVRECLLGRF